MSIPRDELDHYLDAAQAQAEADIAGNPPPPDLPDDVKAAIARDRMRWKRWCRAVIDLDPGMWAELQAQVASHGINLDATTHGASTPTFSELMNAKGGQMSLVGWFWTTATREIPLEEHHNG